MDQQLTTHRRSLFVGLLLSVVALCSLLMLSAAAPANADYKQFCWGKYFPGGSKGAVPNICNSYVNDGIVDYITEVGGSGSKRSVCVFVWYGDGSTMCSAGPNQGVYNTTPAGKFQSIGQIDNNATGDNVVYGYVITCASACP